MGYQVVELEAIDNLLIKQSSLELQIAILAWLLHHLKDELVDKRIELDVIKVTYMGSYPAIGIRYLYEGTDNLEEFVVKRCEYILNNVAVNDLLQFVSLNNDFIREIMNKFIVK